MLREESILLSSAGGWQLAFTKPYNVNTTNQISFSKMNIVFDVRKLQLLTNRGKSGLQIPEHFMVHVHWVYSTSNYTEAEIRNGTLLMLNSLKTYKLLKSLVDGRRQLLYSKPVE